jgi:hypothetical protein
MSSKELLLPFCRGVIGESERLEVERELLTDPELLVDFLDLKRTEDGAEAIPDEPSVRVWFALKQKIGPRKRLIFSLALGAAAAAILLSVLFFKSGAMQNPPAKSFLFDSNSELSSGSSVL